MSKRWGCETARPPPEAGRFSSLRDLMAPEEYLKLRLEDQIDWYDRKSAINKAWFKWLSIVEIVSASAIPVLAPYAGESLAIKVATGILGALIAVIASIKSLMQLQKNWIDYRTTSESLKKEKFLFLTASEPYAHERAFSVLVQRVEALISKENTDWAQYIAKAEAKNKVEKQAGNPPGAARG